MLIVDIKDKRMTDDEMLVGSLLLRHILQLVCNAHAITELQVCDHEFEWLNYYTVAKHMFLGVYWKIKFFVANSYRFVALTFIMY